jgi:cytochrome c-type biogenesis protein
VFLHAVAFVLGFSIVFVALGASVAYVGLALSRWMLWIQRIGGMIIVVFGLSTMGLVKLPFLYMDRRVQYRKRSRLGYVSSLLMGVFFSAGWIPCVGPVLAAIYFLASSTQTASQGALLLAVYSLGLGIPFLVTGAAFSTMTGILRRLNRHLRVVSIITGLFLVVIGALLVLDQFTVLAGWLTSRLGTGLATAELSTDPSATITYPIAFAAGFLSFLSPCVLPLIPGYLSYLSGAAVTSGTGPKSR